MKTIGLALGGGGVRGLAHVPVMEALDEWGLKPSLIAGTSMGAIIGALYAAGLPGRAIRERIQAHIIAKADTWREVLEKKTDLLKWVNAFTPEIRRGGLFKTDRFFEYLFAEIGRATFEQLDLPLIVVAADYWEAREVVFESGELLPALRASMAVPGIFAPVALDGRVLVDGGMVNLLPYEHLAGRCDLTIAVDVSRVRMPGKRETPGLLESVLGAFDIMQTAAVKAKMRYRRPDVYVHPEIPGVRMLEFSKAEQVLDQAGTAITSLGRQLRAHYPALAPDATKRRRPLPAGRD